MRNHSRPTNEDLTPALAWEIFPADPHHDMVDIRLHPPDPGNQPDTWRLTPTIRVYSLDLPDRDGRIFIGFRRIFAAIVFRGYQPAHKGMIYDRDGVLDAIPDRDGVEFTGPVGQLECIEGDLLGDESLAVIEPVSHDLRDENHERAVAIVVCADDRCFKFARSDSGGRFREQDPAAQEKDAILNRLVYLGRKRDRSGRVTVTRVRMRRREDN